MSSAITASVLALVAGAAAGGPALAAPSGVLGRPRPLVDAAGVLELVTSNGQQQIEVEVGPVAGEVRVSGIAGVSGSTTFTGVTAIDLRTGRAQDFVEFRIFAAEIPAITVNTGAGDSDVKFIYATPFTLLPVSSDVTVIGGTGNDKVAFEVISEADDFTAVWAVNHGAGENEASASVLSEMATTSLSLDMTYNGGNGKDKLEFVTITSAAATELRYAGTMRGGEDSAIFSAEELEPGSMTQDFSITLGDGDDVAEAITVLRGGTGTLSGALAGGRGGDVLKMLFEGDGSTSLVLNGNGGNDELDSEYKGAVTGAPSLLGGSGNDKLKIVAEQPGLMVPFINGGPGFDEAIGFGRIVNVEQIN